ncbi:quinon protein alcohol dehydrogenase-like superfamily [Phycomyces nitens]|nr:quinon protein alcohol dehydrogenase-like superfamily [Phycomyces nitens]
MLECPTFSVSIGIPIFGLGFTSTNHLIIGGGGGGGRSGVQNKLSAYRIDGRRKDLEEEAVYDVPAGEDAPMCLAVHPTDHYVVAGINEPTKEIEAGFNKHCRVFHVTEEEFTLNNSIQVSTSKKADEYQKVARFSEDGSLVAVGTSDGHAEVFKYPSFTSNGPAIKFDDEVLDVDIGLDNDKLTCVTRDALKLITIRGKNAGKVLQTLPAASIDKKRKMQFRSFRYGRGAVKDVGFAIVNCTDKPAGYVARLNAYTFETIKIHKVSKKPITAMCTSFDGAVLAIASSDFTITLFDASSMQVKFSAKQAL